MMTKSRSASWTLIKVGFALPVLTAVLFFFTAGSPAVLSAQGTQNQPVAEKQITAQDKTAADSVYQVVEVMPEYPGGMDAMTKYLVETIKYPEEARTKGVQGRVFVQYIVEKDGSVSHVKVIRGIGSGCDEEAVRVVSGMPKWSPGKNANGKPVRVQFNLPIMFSLGDKEKKPEEVK